MFKVGDKVRLIKGTDCTYGFQVGGIYKITSTNIKGVHKIQIINQERKGYVDEEHIEKVFTKSDLKDGDVITHRNGDKRVKAVHKFSNETSYLLEDDFREDLTVKSNMKQHDIIKVERPIKYETVYERKEEILDEAEKRYLRDVIRPFRDKIEYIEKNWCLENEECIVIAIKDSDEIIFTSFEEYTEYKNMELDKPYTLEELRTTKE